MYPNQPFPEQTLVEALHKLPKPAIPQADAQFHKHSIERYTGGIAIYPEQPFQKPSYERYTSGSAI